MRREGQKLTESNDLSGSSTILNFTNLHPAQSYFSDKIGEIQVASAPSHGTLGLLPRPEVPIRSFPYSALQEGKVVYSHDGSETVEDRLSVVAVAQLPGEGNGGTMVRKLSAPHPILIHVLSTNDQVPRVVNNTGSWVWMGGQLSLHNGLLGKEKEGRVGRRKAG